MLDTLKYSKHLQRAGINKEHADAQAEALHEAVSESVATKAQLETVKIELSAEMKHIRWMLGLAISLITAVLVKLLLM